MRRSDSEKLADILLFFDTKRAQLEAGKTFQTAYRPSVIAKELGYKSANSIRQHLYRLSDAGHINLVSFPAKGCVTDNVWFCPKGFTMWQKTLEWEV